MIKINNNKKTLSVEVDFKVWLESTPKLKKSTRLYGNYGKFPYGVYDDEDYYSYPLDSIAYWDDVDDYPQDDYPNYDDYNPSLKELTERYGGTCIDKPYGKKHRSKKKGKNKRSIGLASPKIKSSKVKRGKNGGCFLDYLPTPSDTYSRLSEERIIYFYKDLKDQNSSIKFNSAIELDNFLTTLGIDVPNSSIVKLFDSFESHCCVDPRSPESGFTELAVAESYGHLRWECDPAISESSDNSDLPF